MTAATSAARPCNVTRPTGRGWRTGMAKRRWPRSRASTRISPTTTSSMTQAICAAPASEPRLSQVV
jgi:hypothetical protein